MRTGSVMHRECALARPRGEANKSVIFGVHEQRVPAKTHEYKKAKPV
jgi:hypothetical protein